MSATANPVRRGGRRGRRTAGMVRIARERISTLFALAEREAARGQGDLADRYVAIARRVGTKYNVRILPEYRELYCRSCSTFWVEGRTVRSRLRSGHRVRTCLSCGRARRNLLSGSTARLPREPEMGRTPIPRDEAVLAELPSEETDSDEESEEE